MVTTAAAQHRTAITAHIATSHVLCQHQLVASVTITVENLFYLGHLKCHYRYLSGISVYVPICKQIFALLETGVIYIK
jgi:hypothetical protein